MEDVASCSRFTSEDGGNRAEAESGENENESSERYEISFGLVVDGHEGSSTAELVSRALPLQFEREWKQRKSDDARKNGTTEEEVPAPPRLLLAGAL